MASTVWKGILAYGQNRIPIKLSVAAKTASLWFNQLHKPDLSRVSQEMRCQFEDKVIPRSEIVTGFEVEPNRYIVVSDADLESAKPASKDLIDLVQFTHFIDPIRFESHYHVSPDGDERSYAVLFAALRKTGWAGVGKITMYRRESVAVVGAGRSGLVLHTLYAAAEVRQLSEFRTDTSLVDPSELRAACRLIKANVADFVPENFSDDFRTKLQAIIAAKVEGAKNDDAAKRAKEAA